MLIHNPFEGIGMEDLVSRLKSISEDVYFVSVRCYNCGHRDTVGFQKGTPIGGKCSNCGCNTLHKV